MALADTAARLIKKYGRKDGQLKRPSLAVQAPGHKPWTVEEIDPAVSTIIASSLAVVVFDAKTILKPEQILPEQTAVAYIASAHKPENFDLLITKNTTYSVMEIEELSPGAETVLYILHLKGL